MSRRAAARALLAGGLAVGGFALANPAGAVEFNVTCNVVVTGGLNLTLGLDQSFTLDASAPPEVNAGTEFTVTIPARTINLPAANSGINISNYTNLSTSYSVSGGTVVPGSGTGGAATSGQTVTLANAGPVSPGALNVPQATFKVTAGAAGTTITVRAVESKLTAHLALPTPTQAATTCPFPDTALATTQVVAPPPPGAPNAVADTAETDKDEPVEIDVLGNDEPNGQFPIDVASLAIVKDPGSGTAAVANGKVTYTPNAGFVGTDSFDYTICSDIPDEVPTESAVLQQVEQPCDTATVTVTVVETAPTGGPTTTTTAAPAPSTTAAAQAVGGGTLPRTGSSNGPLLVIGFALVAAGLAIRFARTSALRGS